MKVDCLNCLFVYDISFDSSSLYNSSVQKLQTTEQMTWKHELPRILHLLEIYKSLFSITTAPCCNLCISSLLAFKWRAWGCFLFSSTLCLQLPIAPEFWSLLEFLSPAKRATGLAMLLDHRCWSNETLLGRDYSLWSLCHRHPACAPFLRWTPRPSRNRWVERKPEERRGEERKGKVFLIKAVDQTHRSGRAWSATAGLAAGVSRLSWPYLHCQGTAMLCVAHPGNSVWMLERNSTRKL